MIHRSDTYCLFTVILFGTSCAQLAARENVEPKQDQQATGHIGARSAEQEATKNSQQILESAEAIFAKPFSPSTQPERKAAAFELTRQWALGDLAAQSLRTYTVFITALGEPDVEVRSAVLTNLGILSEDAPDALIASINAQLTHESSVVVVNAMAHIASQKQNDPRYDVPMLVRLAIEPENANPAAWEHADWFVRRYTSDVVGKSEPSFEAFRLNAAFACVRQGAAVRLLESLPAEPGPATAAFVRAVIAMTALPDSPVLSLTAESRSRVIKRASEELVRMPVEYETSAHFTYLLTRISAQTDGLGAADRRALADAVEARSAAVGALAPAEYAEVARLLRAESTP